MPITHQNRQRLLAGVSIATLVMLVAPAWAEEASEAVQVPKISVTDTADTGTAPVSTMTEGSKSYAAQATGVGDKVGTPLKETANTVSVETRQYLDDRGITDVFQALRYMPGVSAINNDMEQNQYSARGYTLDGMFNGIPSYSSLSTFQQFDMAIYDHLEYLHGPAGLLDGSGNPGGVVNFVSKKAQKTAAASTTETWGSWNNHRAEGDVTGPLNTDGSLRARLVAVAQDRNFYYDNASQVKRVGYGEIEYDIGPATTISTALTAQHNRQTPFYGQPLYSNGQTLNVSRSFNSDPAWAMSNDDIYQQEISVEHHLKNDWVAKAQAFWREDTWTDTNGVVFSAVNSSNLASYRLSTYDYHYYHHGEDAYLSGPFDLLGRTHKLTVGANVDTYNYDGSSGSTTLSNVNIFNLPSSVTNPATIPFTSATKNDTTQYGPYGQLRVSLLEPLTLVVGGRDTTFNNKYKSVPPSTATSWTQGAKATNHATPYGGLIYDVNKEISLYGSWSDIFVPQTSPVYGGGVLPPREGEQYEFGTKGSWLDGKLNSLLSYYDLDDTNRAYADPNHTNFYLPMGEMETRGVDFEVNGKPAPGWDVSASYSYMISQYVMASGGSTGMTPNTWFPRHMVKAWGKYTFETGELKGLSLGMGVYAQTQYWGNGSNSYIAQSGFGTFDGLIGYELNDNASLNFNAYNITDTKYMLNKGRSMNSYNTYGDPRNFLLSVKFKM